MQSSTFYDSLGRATETRTPGPGSGYDTLVITTYNDQAHSVWQSVPFEVTHGSGWVDPNGVKDYQGVAPGGTVTFFDALGRAIAAQDPLYGSSQEPGIACSATLSGTYTACTNYATGTVAGDSNTYASITSIDPNRKLTVSGTTDYPKGQLTQSLSNTYLTGTPGGDTVTTTESFEHDARGRLSAEQLQFGTLPSSWGITTNLPSYLAQYTYNDADQLTTTPPAPLPAGKATPPPRSTTRQLGPYRGE